MNDDDDDDDDDDDNDDFFCGMVDGQKAFSLIISSQDHCKAGFEPAQNLRSGFDK